MLPDHLHISKPSDFRKRLRLAFSPLHSRTQIRNGKSSQLFLQCLQMQLLTCTLSFPIPFSCLPQGDHAIPLLSLISSVNLPDLNGSEGVFICSPADLLVTFPSGFPEPSIYFCQLPKPHLLPLPLLLLGPPLK